MVWENGTHTEIINVGDRIQITDIGERMATGSAIVLLSIDESMDLATSTTSARVCCVRRRAELRTSSTGHA